MSGFVHHISIGPSCISASMLREAGLRRGAYPFDWLFADPRMVADCLEDDFAAFLDPRHLIPCPERRACRHELYQARYHMAQGAVFNHHNPAQAEDRAYFERAIARWRQALATPDKTLLTMIIEHTALGPDFAQTVSRIHRAAHGAAILALILHRAPEQPRGEIQIAGRAERILALRLTLHSAISNGVTFDQPEDSAVVVKLLHHIRAQ